MTKIAVDTKDAANAFAPLISMPALQSRLRYRAHDLSGDCTEREDNI
ncbi:hypothetical protein KMZ15_07975 [Mycoavidus sp. HKI]|nr:hypothetical protein [Mycoavidus sp. HKI]UAW63975.1 hypothetical protein KMZ15_07975 [Mycoavidus sp. HKI]